MVKIWMATAFPHLVAEQTQKPEGQSSKLKCKSQLCQILVAPWLTTGVGLVLSLTSVAHRSIAAPQPNSAIATPQQLSQKPLSSKSQLLSSGTEVSLNGQTLPAAWGQWQSADRPGKVRTAVSDAGVAQLLGVELLNTSDAAKQPVRWFSPATTTPLVLTSWLQAGYRYLDITQLAAQENWQLASAGNTLRITTPAAQVKNIRRGKQAWGERLVIDLDRSTFWQMAQQPPPPKPKPAKPPNLNSPLPAPFPPKPKPAKPPKPPNQEWLLTIAATTTPELSQRLTPPAANAATKTTSPPPIKLEKSDNRTIIRLSVPAGLSPRVSTLANPSRLVIDLRPDAMVERDILWYPGLRWRQQFQKLGKDRFPVVWLEVNPRATGLTFKPIWSEATSLVGIAPMIETARRSAAALPAAAPRGP